MKTSDIPIASPCGQDWQAMSPRGTSRFCGDCKKLVHDLSTLREKDAQKLLATKPAEGLCVRYLYDEHGNVWFRDTMLVRVEGLLKKTAAAAALAAAPFLTACLGAAPGDYGANVGEQDSDAAAPSDTDAGVLGADVSVATPTVRGDDAGDASTTEDTDAGDDADAGPVTTADAGTD